MHTPRANYNQDHRTNILTNMDNKHNNHSGIFQQINGNVYFYQLPFCPWDFITTTIYQNQHTIQYFLTKQLNPHAIPYHPIAPITSAYEYNNKNSTRQVVTDETKINNKEYNENRSCTSQNHEMKWKQPSNKHTFRK